MINLSEEELISAIHDYINDNYYGQYDGADIFGNEIVYHYDNKGISISVNIDIYDETEGV